MTEVNTPFLQRVILRNYKSIKECDVSLGPLMFLVGPNGSGKSNFLDALRFVAASLHGPMQRAFDHRGGPMEVFSRFDAVPPKLEIDLRLNLPGGKTASFRFVVRPNPPYEFVVEEEACAVHGEGASTATYRVREGKVTDATFEPRPAAATDRLYLTIASSFAEFREVYQHLAGVLFYKIDPEQTRRHPFASGSMLHTNGAGLGSVLRRISDGPPELKQRIDEYARAILPDLDQISVKSLGELARDGGAPSAKVATIPDEMKKLFLRFTVGAGDDFLHFSAQNMSDGTLRALGVLLALFQCAYQPPGQTFSLVGIEEPEATVHPAAAGVLFDALHEASEFVQVVATTHSADLLDIKGIRPESLLIVDMVDGKTVIGPADEVSRSIMRDRLATAGELLRQNQLRPQTELPRPVGADADEG